MILLSFKFVPVCERAQCDLPSDYRVTLNPVVHDLQCRGVEFPQLSPPREASLAYVTDRPNPLAPSYA